jgi:hypothetical protein
MKGPPGSSQESYARRDRVMKDFRRVLSEMFYIPAAALA